MKHYMQNGNLIWKNNYNHTFLSNNKLELCQSLQDLLVIFQPLEK